jgi:type II secretory pathway pseudopilin PulG
MKFSKTFKNSESGQTLVETVVGVFVLAVGISTALGLAVSIYNASSSAIKQVLGAGLAREGAEAVFNMRATNWLKGQLVQTCYNYANAPATDAYCHQDWLNPGVVGTYNLTAGTGKCYTLDFDPSTPTAYWQFTAQASCATNSYRLNYDASATKGFYTTSNVGVPSDYYRQIVLVEQTGSSFTDVTGATSPAVGYYQASVGSRLKVISRVWWNDRSCPQATTWAATSPKCRVELVSYLTNWRNY